MLPFHDHDHRRRLEREQRHQAETVRRVRQDRHLVETDRPSPNARDHR